MPSTPAGTIRVGIAGWTFPPWRGTFYPTGLRQKDELAHAAATFATLEINGTFYSLQHPKSFAEWHAQTPADFVFSLKAPRFITHMKRLRDVAAPIANFLASGPLRLGAKLGPILWQLPPNLRFDPALIEVFLALLPHDTEAAATIARTHEPRLEGRAHTETDARRPLRHAIEVRHESFADPACIDLLRAHDVALVVTDGVDEFPRLADLTAGFVYARLHLPRGQAGGYDHAALAAWAARARAWSRGATPADGRRIAPDPPALASRDVFLYCDAAGDETVKLWTPDNARTLQDLTRA